MATSSPTTDPMDERGFLFMLPHLGPPSPAGEWHVVKAAIGRQRDMLDLIVDSTIQTPLHPPVAVRDKALVPVEFQSAIWVLTLVRPQSTLTTAPPEFFSIQLKRAPPSALQVPATKLPSDIDWLFWPMSTFEEYLAATRGESVVSSPMYGCGSAEDVRLVKAYMQQQQRQQQ